MKTVEFYQLQYVFFIYKSCANYLNLSKIIYMHSLFVTFLNFPRAKTPGMRQLYCLKRKGVKELRSKSPDTPNPLIVVLTAAALGAKVEALEKGDEVRNAGKLGRTPVVVKGKTANCHDIGV